MTKNELIESLSSNAVNIKFTKKDGSIRNMKCTRSLSIIPVEYHPKSKIQTIAEETDNIKVFDVDIAQWRSFNFSAIIS